MQTLKPRIKTQGGRLAVLPPPSRANGYRIRGRGLQSIRAEHLRREPLCVLCKAKGIVAQAQELDHIVPLRKGGTDTPDNRQGLCIPCHAAKTIEDLKG